MRKSLKKVLFLLILASIWEFGGTVWRFEPEYNLDVPSLISYYGYPSEVHTVLTDDEYALTLHRIPGKTPILLVHGFPYGSYGWVLNKPPNSLAFLLANDGYDVWMINLRGTSSSQLNNKISKDTKKFWDFDWDEHGLFDIPAAIDYIIKTTGQKQIHYLSHSMGSTASFIMFANRQEYNLKVTKWICLAPVTTLAGLGSPSYLLLLPTFPVLNVILELFGKYYFFPLNQPGLKFCRKIRIFCRLYNFLLEGGESPHFDVDQIPAIYSFYPDFDSSRVVFHYRQVWLSQKFTAYDHGPVRNLKEYKSVKPPEHNISKIAVKTVIYHGGLDKVSTPKAVRAIAQLLPNVREVNYLKTFNHGDFLFARDYYIALYSDLSKHLNE